jgi:hypothetical protein
MASLNVLGDTFETLNCSAVRKKALEDELRGILSVGLKGLD